MTKIWKRLNGERLTVTVRNESETRRSDMDDGTMLFDAHQLSCSYWPGEESAVVVPPDETWNVRVWRDGAVFLVLWLTEPDDARPSERIELQFESGVDDDTIGDSYYFLISGLRSLIRVRALKLKIPNVRTLQAAIRTGREAIHEVGS